VRWRFYPRQAKRLLVQARFSEQGHKTRIMAERVEGGIDQEKLAGKILRLEGLAQLIEHLPAIIKPQLRIDEQSGRYIATFGGILQVLQDFGGLSRWPDMP